jgi:hypothetical protein
MNHYNPLYDYLNEHMLNLRDLITPDLSYADLTSIPTRVIENGMDPDTLKVEVMQPLMELSSMERALHTQLIKHMEGVQKLVKQLIDMK